jgi:hypothetical protein
MEDNKAAGENSPAAFFAHRVSSNFTGYSSSICCATLHIAAQVKTES